MSRLKILTKDVPLTGLEINLNKNASEFDFSKDIVFLEPLEISASLNPRGDTFEFKGNLKTVVEEECSRCLRKFPLSITTAFKIDYEPISAQPDYSAHEVELSAEDFDISYYSNELLELDVDLRDVVLLARPMTPLCVEDCQGVCPQCGSLKEIDKCQCAVSSVDERWQGLAQFKKKLEEE